MKRDEFARNLAAGTYDLIVLDILRDGPSYGYGIRQRIFARSKGTLNWQDGTIYPVLRHLEEQGLVTSKWQTPQERPPTPLLPPHPARPPSPPTIAPPMDHLHSSNHRPVASVIQ